MAPVIHPRIAVVADAHFHDLHGDYGLPDQGGATGRFAIRRLAETARSLRVFNESHTALLHTLDDIAARGIRHVVLLGDYSDDGQIASLAGLRRILERYSKRAGLHFYAVPGNHDIFGTDGRHRTKRFMNATGGYDVATSDPTFRDAGAGQVGVSSAMYCPGYPQGLSALPDVGFFGTPSALHWETPFGREAGVDSRLYPVDMGNDVPAGRLMDASYLIEPFDGVWLMMIDANVFRPFSQAERPLHREDYADSASAGWNAMLTHKPFMLNWMKDVALRAQVQGKRLLTFSHYPVLDPLDGTGLDEQTLLGLSGFAKRIPEPTVGRAMIECGITTLFSGHLHINDTARYREGDRFVINVSVPSLVAFPGAYKIIGIRDTTLEIETVEIADMPLNPKVVASYREEILQTGLNAQRLADCSGYGDFLNEHIGHLVARRHLKRDWPQDLANLFHTTTLADLAAIALTKVPNLPDDLSMLRTGAMAAAIADAEVGAGLDHGRLAEVPSLSFLQDWYRLRMGSDIAIEYLPQGDLRAYRLVADLFARLTAVGDSVQARLALVFMIFTKYLTGLPSHGFSIDLQTGDLRPRPTTDGLSVGP